MSDGSTDYRFSHTRQIAEVVFRLGMKLLDRLGAFGSGLTTAVANPAAQIDFSARDFRLEGINYE